MAPKTNIPPKNSARIIKDKGHFFDFYSVSALVSISVSAFISELVSLGTAIFLPRANNLEIIQRSKWPTTQNISATGNKMIAGGCPPFEVTRIAQAMTPTMAQTIGGMTKTDI